MITLNYEIISYCQYSIIKYSKHRINNTRLMKLSRETSRKRFPKLTTVKFTVSGRPYTPEREVRLERFETDQAQSRNSQISKQQNNLGTYLVFCFVFLRRKEPLCTSLFEVLRSFPFFIYDI